MMVLDILICDHLRPILAKIFHDIPIEGSLDVKLLSNKRMKRVSDNSDIILSMSFQCPAACWEQAVRWLLPWFLQSHCSNEGAAN